jgi:selenocysteine lyase/cysteine desulfurase
VPVRQGGTGTTSEEESVPHGLPERYEAGNLNVAGIAGLEAGAAYVSDNLQTSAAHLQMLTMRLVDGLQELASVKTYGPKTGDRVGVVSLNVAGYDPQELAALLDAQWSIQSRAGLHCAPRMHAALGTLPSGTLRLSLGHFTSEADVDAALKAIAELAAG